MEHRVIRHRSKERLGAGAELLGVMARDHVIVAADDYYSFVERGAGVDVRAARLSRLALTDRAWFGETDREFGVIGVGE